MKVFLARMAGPAAHFTRQTNTTVPAGKDSQGRAANFVSTEIFYFLVLSKSSPNQ